MKFGTSEAERAARFAKQISDTLAKHYGDARIEAQEAYIAGYQAVEEASEEELRHLWPARAEIYINPRADWQQLHRAIHAFLRMPTFRAGVLDWLPAETTQEHLELWDSLLRVLGPGTLYDRAMRGVLHALDEWAVREGLLERQEH